MVLNRMSCFLPNLDILDLRVAFVCRLQILEVQEVVN
jgi:hypothetical protein